MNQNPRIVLVKLCLAIVLLIGNLGCHSSEVIAEDLHIRINQVGYFPNEIKSAIVFSAKNLKAHQFSLLDAKSKKVIFTNKLSENKGTWGNFNFHYLADFTAFVQQGNYTLEVGGRQSSVFKINNDIYSHIVDSLLTFLTVQRCGPTNPILHGKCHLFDSHLVIGDAGVSGVDLTGGWHDAGDYIKFMNTTAYTTYMLLVAYEMNKDNLQNDANRNNVPDILEEARVGIDWLVRANYSGNKLISQVQDSRDHDQGWRLPENDTSMYQRPAFKADGKNLIGMYCAALSIASRIWKEQFHDDKFASELLARAERIFYQKNYAADVDKTTNGMYTDNSSTAKLTLGAIELYQSTNKQSYLDEAKTLTNSLHADYWWSWGDINSLAMFRVSDYFPNIKDEMLKNLSQFNSNKNSNIYGEATAYTWGMTHTMLGVALQSQLWKKMTQSKQFDSLAIIETDYIFGRNPWGVSFVANYGTYCSKKFHSQISFFNHGYLPGAISAGPAPENILKSVSIKRENSNYSEFNSAEVKYYDDRQDYITNEPTIVTNATAIMLFSTPFFNKK